MVGVHPHLRYVTNQRWQPVVPVDRWGRPIVPRTIAPTSSPSTSPNAVGGDSSTGKDEAADNSSIAIVVGVALLIVIGIVVGAIWYVRRSQDSGEGDGPRSTSFDNPMYSDAPGAISIDVDAAPSGATTGYVDVPANSGYVSSTFVRVVMTG